MKTVRRLVRKAVVLVVAIVACVALSYTTLSDTPFGEAVQQVTEHVAASTGAADAVLDASGIKSQVSEALQSNIDAVAQATGLDESQAQELVEGLDVEAWSVAELPTDAVESASVDVSYGGVEATVTTYDDPSYVTVEVAGQAATLEVPESAQEYLGYLALLPQ